MSEGECTWHLLQRPAAGGHKSTVLKQHSSKRAAFVMLHPQKFASEPPKQVSDRKEARDLKPRDRANLEVFTANV